MSLTDSQVSILIIRSSVLKKVETHIISKKELEGVVKGDGRGNKIVDRIIEIGGYSEFWMLYLELQSIAKDFGIKI